MSIKQNGGVFGRNPTFNDVTIEGQLTFDGDIDINSDLKVDGDLEVTGLSNLNGGLNVTGGSVGIGTIAPYRQVTVSGAPSTIGGDGTGVIAALVNDTTAYNASPTIGLSFWNKVTSGGAEFPSAVIQAGKSNATTGDYSGYLSFQTTDATATSNEVMRIDATGAATFSDNIIIGTSGKGIDFSATAGTGTSELLDDYEEGVWSPADNSGGGLSFTVTAAAYTKIGRAVFASFDITYPVTADTNYAGLTGLPFVSKNTGTVAIAVTNSSTLTYCATGSSDDVVIFLYDNTGGLIQNNTLSGKVIRATAIYYSA